MLTEDDLLDFARSCASAYCAKYGAWSQFDDAVGSVCLYLLQRRERWPYPRATIRRHVALHLISVYRKETGARRSKQARRADVNVETLKQERDDVEAFDNRDEARYKILRAATNAGVVEYLPVLVAKGEGKTLDELAREFSVSSSTINRIYNRFLTALVNLEDAPGVKIVEPTDQGDEPLFRAKK